MSVFTRGPYGRLAVVLNTLSSTNIEIIIIIIIIQFSHDAAHIGQPHYNAIFGSIETDCIISETVL